MSLILLASLALKPTPPEPVEPPLEQVEDRYPGFEPYALPTESDPFHLILHSPEGRTAPTEDCDVDLCRSMVTMINGAQDTVDFALYGVRGQPAIVNALIDAQARGVTVRGVFDRTVDGRNYYTDSDLLSDTLGTVHDDLATDRRSAAARTKENRDPSSSRCFRPHPEGFEGPKQCLGYDLGDSCLIAVHASRETLDFEGEIMHNKFVVVDGTYLWMGSTNASDSGTGGYNANVVGVWHSPQLAEWYTAEFDEMYSGVFHNDKAARGRMRTQLDNGKVTAQVYFSPQDKPLTRAVRPLIQNARERIDISVFFLTNKYVTGDLIEAHQRGVQVRIIMDATGAKNGYTKHELLRAAGIPVKVEDWGGKMHMKSMAVDSRHVVLGSMNWTAAGEGGNDENTIVVNSPAHAHAYHDFFEDLWGGIPDRWLEENPNPESLDSPPSCTDGSDNDFDRLRDDQDPGCTDAPPPMPPLPPYAVVPKADGYDLVKGEEDVFGKRTFYQPDHPLYPSIRMGKRDTWLCSVNQAWDEGYRPPN